MKCYFHSDKILTGSFDKTARLWSAETGECYNTLWGHTAEVVTVQFNPHSLLVGTSSMDSTARLYHIATGQFDMIFPFLQCFSLLHVVWLWQNCFYSSLSICKHSTSNSYFYSTQMSLLGTSTSSFPSLYYLVDFQLLPSWRLKSSEMLCSVVG